MNEQAYIPFGYHSDRHDEIMQAVDNSIDLVHQLALKLQKEQS